MAKGLSLSFPNAVLIGQSGRDLMIRVTSGNFGYALCPHALGGHGSMTMRELYFVLAALHIVSMVSTGILWTLLDLKLAPSLKPHFRDIRAVHFGSLYLVPWFLGLAYAFDRLKVPEWHQAFFPIGLGALVFFSGLGYVFPRPPGLDPFYYWTKGWAMVVSMIGLAALVFALLWTAVVLVLYAVAR